MFPSFLHVASIVVFLVRFCAGYLIPHKTSSYVIACHYQYVKTFTQWLVWKDPSTECPYSECLYLSIMLNSMAHTAE